MFIKSIVAFCIVAQVAAFAPGPHRHVSMAVKSSTEASVIPESEEPSVPLSDPATFTPTKKEPLNAKWFPFGGVKVK